ncbi:hypothetical protein PFLL34_02472 [Pseudomonas fluorescens]|nr:hypothetical protein PFLL34_02472 [Pseudomonas fluorescens]
MRSFDPLDRIVLNADAKQTGIRFQSSRIQLQPTVGEARAPHLQIVIMEVWKSLGSAANE